MRSSVGVGQVLAGALSLCCGDVGPNPHTTYLFLQAAFHSVIVITQLTAGTALEK